MPFVERTASDSGEFVQRVETIITLAVAARPSELYLVRIRNWFGERWLGFAGKMLGAFGVSYREELVIPPFVPGRVIEEARFKLHEDDYVRIPDHQALHVAQTSKANFRRDVDVLLPQAAFVWFSSDSATNGRGSVMAYVPTASGHKSLYVEFVAKSDWSPRRLIGITRAELEPMSQPCIN